MKKEILNELKKKDFPNLKLLYSEECLKYSLEVLRDLLNQEKKDFEKLISIPKQELNFDSFEDEGILSYYWSLLNHLQNVNNTKQIREIIEEFRPEYEDFGNYVAYNRDYFDRLVYVNENCSLDDEEKRCLFLRIKAFKDRGIDLSEEKQDQLKQINKELSKISHDFSNNIVDDEEKWNYEIDNFDVIKELPEDVLSSAKKGDKYVFTSDPTHYISIMKYCSDQKIRKDFENKRNSTASSGKYDNRKNILDILILERKRALLLGYKNYAELSLNDKMADSPEQIFELIEGISLKAKEKAREEIKTLKEYFSLDTINSYDLAYYSSKYKKEKFDIDDKILKEYFEFESVLKYLHNFIKEFFGIELKQIKLDTYSDDIKIYEVYKNDKLISYYFLDSFYRKEKRGGAWADDLRSKQYLESFAKVPIVVNVCNFMKSESDILLNISDVETIFHEFGHAIHEMLSFSKHSELSGFGVEWDFVELPSQLLENWVTDRDSLSKLAIHYKTGKPISQELLDKLEDLKTYMSGNHVVRQNEFALLDMSLYYDEAPSDIYELDKKVLSIVNKFGFWKREENYKMYCSFGHIFRGGYSAGYYSYMWAEMLEADVFDKIKSKGIFNPEVGKELVNSILGQGTIKPANELFYDFMGRDLDNKAFMKRKGFID